MCCDSQKTNNFAVEIHIIINSITKKGTNKSCPSGFDATKQTVHNSLTAYRLLVNSPLTQANNKKLKYSLAKLLH